MYELYLLLVGKPVYDFLFVIIELFLLALTVETLQAEICRCDGELLLPRPR